VTPPAERAVERVFSEALERALLAYSGKWVAISQERVIASGETPAEALRLAAVAGYRSGLLLHFVQEEGSAYFF